jgi:hypothetical protein
VRTIVLDDPILAQGASPIKKNDGGVNLSFTRCHVAESATISAT